MQCCVEYFCSEFHRTVVVYSTNFQRKLSKVQLVKSYVRSTMVKSRSYVFSIVFTEADFVQEPPFGDVVSEFASENLKQLILIKSKNQLVKIILK